LLLFDRASDEVASLLSLAGSKGQKALSFCKTRNHDRI
jgi:hypothetical protein